MRERRRRHDDLHRPMGGRGKRATPPKVKVVIPERCASHTTDDLDMVSAAMDADERLARGERQEQCAKCWRWFWEHQRGPGFVATDAKDTD